MLVVRCLWVRALVMVCAVFCSNVVSADADGEEKIAAKALSKTIYLITGKGGNMGASIGEDGTFLIDDKFAPLTGSIVKQLKALGGDTPRFVINTHWHGDHTGGNENLGKQGAIIVAHDNVRKRLSEDNFLEAFNAQIPALSAIGLPTITFANEVSFHLNGDTVEITHIANAHTDGDSVVLFKKENILHAGDLFFNGFYPFIDIHHGGSLKGMLNAANLVLDMVDDSTQIIPGHGPMADKKALLVYRDMLSDAYEALRALKADGKTVQQAIAAKPLAALDANWGNGLFKTDRWIELIYDGLE